MSRRSWVQSSVWLFFCTLTILGLVIVLYFNITWPIWAFAKAIVVAAKCGLYQQIWQDTIVIEPTMTTWPIINKFCMLLDLLLWLLCASQEDFTLPPLFRSESTGVHWTPLDSTGLRSIPNGTGTPSDFEYHESPLHFSSWNRAESTGNKHQSPVIVQSDQPEFHWSPLESAVLLYIQLMYFRTWKYDMQKNDMEENWTRGLRNIVPTLKSVIYQLCHQCLYI